MDSCFYEVFNLVGEGSFGKVYKARCRRTNELVAYKVISKTGRKPSEVFVLREECKIQKYLQHPNIIRMINSFETENELVVVTEFAQRDLCQMLKHEGVFTELKAKKVLCDLISALYYLHSNRVLHRDLKPQNVLLDANGTAKLCDFGFAKSLGSDLKVLTSIKGTPLYMAPELMNESPYDHNADLWSLGCIAYELLTGHTPYTTTSILQLIKMVKLNPIKWPNYLSDVCLSFLKGLLEKNPLMRLSWPYLLHHAFVAAPVHPIVPEFNRPNLYQPLPINAYNFVPIQHSIGNAIHDQPIQRITSKNHLSSNSSHSQFTNSNDNENKSNTDDSNDATLVAQKEEWLVFLKKTIEDVMYGGDADVLMQKPSLMLIMNAFNTCKKCPIVVTTVSRLLSLPFVVESISESQISSIKQNYSHCVIIKDLVNVSKQIIIEMSSKKQVDSSRETALQHLSLLMCNLTFVEQSFLKQFFTSCVSADFFKMVKNILSIRTKNEPLSIVKYFISIFLRLYMLLPQSRAFVVASFRECVPEFHAILRENEDTTAQMRLCIFITILGSTHTKLFSEMNGVDDLIKDLNQLRLKHATTSLQQVTESTLEVLNSDLIR